ncbi:hypothetical protein EDC01DRAFT_785467 [Geopyxis carbonaria]|nr:hypothetical protein EDC01DRAFT_785467 [Geopyxis carbonaria]
MPNKKARKRNEPKPDFDLDPSGAPAPPSAPPPKPRHGSKSKGPSKPPIVASQNPTKRKKRASKGPTDDTPKAFARMMAITSGTLKPRKGLDEGAPSKKRKRDDEATAAIRAGLKIRANESLREFGRRVDTALPVKFPRSTGSKALKDAADGKDGKPAKKAKEVRKTQEELDLENEDLSEEEDPEVDLWADDAYKGRKSRARAAATTQKRGASPDPWAALEAKRAAPRFGEVAAAPPALVKPKEVFKVYGGARVDVDSVPRGAGSLAKREELAGERRGLIAAYRKMMEGKRGAEAAEVRAEAGAKGKTGKGAGQGGKREREAERV